jgi:hypothetical protein
MSQKVAWARSHGVVPPDFVVIAAALEQQASQTASIAAAPVKKRCPHCQHEEDDDCDHPKPATTASAKPTAPEHATGVISLLSALKCQGGGFDGISGQAYALPLKVDKVEITLNATGSAVIDSTAHYLPFEISPPVPPPRAFI